MLSLARDRLDYMVIGADGNSYNRYLGLNCLVYWYYDDTVDEDGNCGIARPESGREQCGCYLRLCNLSRD